MPVIGEGLVIPFLVGGEEAPPAYITNIRERPPTRLMVDVESPDGQHTRWARDEGEPGNVPMNLNISSVMPGGFERATCTLERDPRINYPDLAELSTITVQGAGGDTAWQGRLEKAPDTAGAQEQVSPEAVGWQAHLEDDNSAREIFVDQELSRWQGASVARKINLLNGNIDEEDASVGVDASGPALVSQITGAWARFRDSEGWYDAQGIPIGLLKYAWMLQEKNKIGDDTVTELWEWVANLSTDDVVSSQDLSGNLRGEGPSGTGTTTATAIRTWAHIALNYTTNGGTDGVQYPVFWPILAVYGTHGLPLYGGLSTSEAPGVLASDAVAYAVGKWAPKLAFTTGPEGTIQPTSFVIGQLPFLEPTTVAEMIKQAIRFELPDWAVWEGSTFYMNPRGARGKAWRARVGPAQLQEAGPQVARLWNGCIVSFSDVTGVTRTVGPPGSGAETVSSLLIDEDPENPLNEIGIRKWAKLSMGTSTVAGATQVGAIFLRETKALETSGNATIVGHIEDEGGVLYPAWAIRAGDSISFVDASDPSPRRVVHASYEDSSKGCTVALDVPPDSLTAILERLSVAISPLGFS